MLTLYFLCLFSDQFSAVSSGLIVLKAELMSRDRILTSDINTEYDYESSPAAVGYTVVNSIPNSQQIRPSMKTDVSRS